jgi:hypothetical protein
VERAPIMVVILLSACLMQGTHYLKICWSDHAPVALLLSSSGGQLLTSYWLVWWQENTFRKHSSFYMVRAACTRSTSLVTNLTQGCLCWDWSWPSDSYVPPVRRSPTYRYILLTCMTSKRCIHGPAHLLCVGEDACS